MERVKLLAQRLAMVVKYDELGEAVLQGRIRWRRENGRCRAARPRSLAREGRREGERERE